MDNTQQYTQFVSAMTQALNLGAMRYGNPLISESVVATLPECLLAFNATVAMSNAVASI